MDGKPTDGWSLDWAGYLLLLIYLVVLERRFSQTVGKVLAHIRTIDTEAPGRVGIPLRKVALRYFLMVAGFAPMLVVFIGFYLANDRDLEAMVAGSFFPWFIGAGVLAFAWEIWIIVDVAQKRDPIYDRIAGTAVLHTPHRAAISSGDLDGGTLKPETSPPEERG